MNLVTKFRRSFLGHGRLQREVNRAYQLPPSLADYLGLVDFDEDDSVGLLNDGRSLMRFLELKPIACDILSEEAAQKRYQTLCRILSSCIPLEDRNPWTVCVWAQNDASLVDLQKRQANTALASLQDDRFTRHMCDRVWPEHYRRVSRGLFVDAESQQLFRGVSRRIRLALCRDHRQPLKGFDYRTQTVEELNEVTERLRQALSHVGIETQICNREHIVRWLLRWLNPNPSRTEGDIDSLLEETRYPNRKPLGFHLGGWAIKNLPETTPEGVKLDGRLHRAVILTGNEIEPDIGLLSRDRDQGAPFLDTLLPGAVMVWHIVFESKASQLAHLQRLEKAAIGFDSPRRKARAFIQHAIDEVQQGNYILRSTQAICLSGKDAAALKQQESDIRGRLDSCRIATIDSRFDRYPADTWLRFLPGNLDLDAHHRHRHRLLSDIVAQMPVWGRARGDERHPVFSFFNRAGESFVFDFLAKDFRRNNAHAVLLGTTGAGKSAWLCNVVLSLSALQNPRIVMLEAGGSFDLLSRYLRRWGRKVVSLRFSRRHPIALNPYAEAYRMLEREHQRIEANVAQQVYCFENVQDEEDLLSDERDLLNEMAIITRSIITGGEKREEEAITRADMGLITQVVLASAERCQQAGKPHMLAEDVAEGFRLHAQKHPEHAERLTQFALSMEPFLHGEMAAFFNRPSEPLPDFDILHVDLGFLKEDGKEAGLNVVVNTLLARILSLAEAEQSSNRPCLFIKDEAHLLYQYPSIVAFSVLMAKVARKIGLWLLPATQNVMDFSGEHTAKLLSLMETWFCLSLSKKEIEEIEKRRQLTREEKKLLTKADNIKGVYSEIVMLGAQFQGLFRHIPPRIALALAMTEKDEKAERAELMKTLGCSESEAVHIIAERLAQTVGGRKSDAVFDS